MHGQHAGLGHQVVHHGEDRLLQLARVARAADEDHALGDVQHDERARARAMARRIRLQLGRMQHGEVGGERRQLLERRPDEHVAHEGRMPRIGRHIAHRQPMRLVGTREQILHEQVLGAIEIRLHIGQERVEVRGLHRLIDLAPVHIRGRRRFPHDELVVRRAARVRRRHGDEGPHVGERAFAAAHGRFDELGRDEVPVHGPARRKPLRREGGRALARNGGDRRRHGQDGRK